MGAVKCEKAFMHEMLIHNSLGMNMTTISQYIEYVADSLLNVLNYTKIYYRKNPFHFMESKCLNVSFETFSFL